MADRSAPLRGWRPGILDRYLIRGVAAPFVVILCAVGTAMMLERGLRLIHELAMTGADIGYFLPLLGYLAPYYLDLALPASFMVALVLLIARLDEQLEIETMLANGMSMTRIAAPLVGFGIVIAIAGLIAGGWLEPLGRYGFRQMRAEAINAGQLARLQPRALYQPVGDLAVTFDRREPQQTVGGLFLWQRLPGGEELMLTSRTGKIGFAGGRLFGIDFDRGRQLIDNPGTRLPYLVQFDSLAFREKLLLQNSAWKRGKDQRELTLPELAAALDGLGSAEIPRAAIATDFYSRIARAAVIPLIPLLVLPLAFATKRKSRGPGIIIAFVLLATFHHGMNFSKQVAVTSADPGGVVLAVAAACAGLILLVFWSSRHLPSHSPIVSMLAPLGRGLARLRPLPRRSDTWVLSGHTLPSYLAWQLTKWMFVGLAAIVALLQMVDLFERGEDFVERGMGLADVGYYALLRIPPMLQQAIPIAVLAGAMTVFMGLARSREMTAMRAAGLSQFRLLRFALPAPLLFAVGSIAVAEVAAPASQVAFSSWWRATEPAGKSPPPRDRWFRIGNEIVRARGASAEGTRLEKVAIFRRDASGLLVERVSADYARLDAGKWRLSDTTTMRITAVGVALSRAAGQAWRADLDPEDVRAFFASANAVTAAAARRSLAETAPVSQGATPFEVRLYRALSEPLTPLIMLLLAIPLAFVPPRTGVAWPALLYAGGGGLLYLVADGVCTVSAQVGQMPVLAGTLAIPLIAVLTGIAVLLYSER